MLVNGTDLYLESDELPAYPAHEQRTCHVFHTEGYMKALFPNVRGLAAGQQRDAALWHHPEVKLGL